MKIVEPPKVNGIPIAYNEQPEHEFTRRIPTYVTSVQQKRDADIAKKIVLAYDSGESANVLRVFMQKKSLLSDPRYWEILRTVWVVCGRTENANLFRKMLTANRGARSWFMTVEDADALSKMEFPKTLYRAYDNEDDPGISWTDNLEWCKEYAANRGRKIKQHIFNREDIYAYISRRGESEFVILKKVNV